MEQRLNSNGPVTDEDVALERRYDITPVPVPDPKPVPIRPHKFTPAVKRKILVSLQMGHFPSTAAGYAGVTEKTLLNWWARGQMAGPDAADVDLELYEFSEMCRQARANSKVGLISILWRHAREDGKVALQLLSKLFPEDYGNTVKHEVNHSGTVQHELRHADYSKFTDEELAEMERLALKAQHEKAKDEAIDAEIIG